MKCLIIFPLNIASARLMSNDNCFNDILIKLNDYLQLIDLNNTGYIAEIIAQIILLKAFDKASIDDTYSRPIKVETFLKILLGKDIYKEIENKIDDSVLKGLICFNHFIKRFNDTTYANVLEYFVQRGAAGKFKDSQNKSDLFIPIVLESSNISYFFLCQL